MRHSSFNTLLQRYGVTDYTVINAVGESCEPRMVYPSGYGLIDDLTYSYNTNNNTLQNVTDAIDFISNGNDFNGKNGNQATYGYSNGNLISDSGKDLNIAYNFLEQSKLITTPEGRIELTYDALGNKLQKRVYAEGFNPDNGPLNECVAEDLMNQQDYLLDFVYRWHYPETKPNSTEAKFRGHRFYHEEGSIEWRRIDSQEENAAFVPCFQYTIRDHLGNGRVYFTKDYDGDGLLDVLQESHYYPFGAQLEGVSRLYDPPGSVPNAFNGYVYVDGDSPTFIEYLQYTHDLKRYNGKEYNRELGLNWYDYGARWYDPVIGRWNAVDPLAEKYYSWNSYNYVLNNPMLLVDPDGRSPNGGNPNPHQNFVAPIEGFAATSGGFVSGGGGGATVVVTKEAQTVGVLAWLYHSLFGEDTVNEPDTREEPKKDPEPKPVDDDDDGHISIYRAPKKGQTNELMYMNGFNLKNFPTGTAHFAEDKELADYYARKVDYDKNVIEVKIPKKTYEERWMHKARKPYTKTAQGKTIYEYRINVHDFDVLNSSEKEIHYDILPTKNIDF